MRYRIPRIRPQPRCRSHRIPLRRFGGVRGVGAYGGGFGDWFQSVRGESLFIFVLFCPRSLSCMMHTDYSIVLCCRRSKTTSTSRIKAPTLFIRRACGLVLRLWFCCSWECSLCCLRASVRGRRGKGRALVDMGIKVVVIVGWGIMGMRWRRLRGGLGGTGGFDEGGVLVCRSRAFKGVACIYQLFKAPQRCMWNILY